MQRKNHRPGGAHKTKAQKKEISKPVNQQLLDILVSYLGSLLSILWVSLKSARSRHSQIVKAEFTMVNEHFTIWL